MRIAIISDIHGNLEAFRRVLEDIEAMGPDRIVSLGDNIGYGPEPEEVVRLVRERAIPSVMGNHELASTRIGQKRWFNPVARKSVNRTNDLLSKDSLRYLRDLPMSLVIEGCRFVHGCPPDSPRRYLYEYDEQDFTSVFNLYAEDMCFVGHTHELELITHRGGFTIRRPLGEGGVELAPGGGTRYIVNTGSVGQPRDGNNNAKYAIWDKDSNILEIRYVSYDIDVTANRIRELGFPEQFASRLYWTVENQKEREDLESSENMENPESRETEAP